MKKKVLALLMCVTLVIGLAACGSADDTDSAGSDSSADESSDNEDSSDDTETEAEGEAIAAIKEAGKIVLLTEATFPPFEYLEGTEYAGIDIDIGEEIADRLGVELEVLDMNFDLLTDALNSDKGDFIAAGFSVSESRKEVVDFTEEYVKSGLMVVLPADSEYTSLEDLAGLSIAVQESTTGHFFAEDNIDNCSILAFKSTVEAGAAVRTGKCDAAVIDVLPAESIVRGSSDELKIMEDVYEEEATAIAVKKGNDDLLAFIQEVLDDMEESGKLQESIDYHLENASDE